ncbi:MAG: T9SS type A sorting domain-containing protein, partial [bacterium]|nr:T9SS type A sorting domain-containing protein [bacterium]
KIYDALGRLVKVLVEGQQAAGVHQINWDGTDIKGREVVSGIYFYTIQAGEFRMTKKMVLMR